MGAFYENTRALCALAGISGDEAQVREAIMAHIGDSESCTVDASGNLIVRKKGAKRAAKQVVFAAHMDEIGFIITGAESDGSLTFAKVGGIDDSILPGKRVKIGSLPGVIGVQPLHLLDAAVRKQVVKAKDLRIDIGAKSREEALEACPPGSTAVFDAAFQQLGADTLKGRALDDRLGCAALLELAAMDLPYDITLLFSVQEEVGLRGAKAAGGRLEADIAVTVETTTAADLDGVEGDERVCCLGDGVVVAFMDGGTIYDRELYRATRALADEHGIPNQTKTRVAGGTDAAALSVSGGGARAIGIAVPARCLHSPGCVIRWSDAEAMLALLKLLAERLPEA